MAICETCDYANRPPYKSPCSECDRTMGSPFCCYKHEEKPTNADRIRAMNDEEFSCFLALVENRKTGKISFDDTSDFWLEWLKQPAKEDAE